MRKSVFIVLLVIIFLLSVTIASSRELYRLRTPEHQRTLYFGEDYVKPLGGFGRKGASRGDFGFKGYTSSSQNLPYNSFIYQGRNPKKISNTDPNMRGYSILDVVVDLVPVQGVTLKNTFVSRPKATARVLSHKTELRDKGIVYLQTRDLPYLAQDEIYEAWLIDEDTDYARTIGIFRSPIVGSSSLNFETANKLHVYDFLIITKEPFPDEDPRPGETIMVGEIPSTRKIAGPISVLAYTGVKR